MKVILDFDPDLQCPADCDCQWTIYSFSRKHYNFKEPEELGLGSRLESDGLPKILNPGLRRRLETGLAHFLSYYEHSGSIWFRKEGNIPGGVEFQWDGTRVAGLLVWEHDPKDMGHKTFEDRAKDADSFLECYTRWANGEGYCFSIENDQGETVESCSGFDDPEYMLGEVASHLEGKEFEVEGEADFLESDLRKLVKELESKKKAA